MRCSRGSEREPLQPQDLVITLLGTYVRPFGRAVWSGGLVMLLREFGFSDGAARAALTRLVRRDLIARVRSGRLVHYRLTPRCERLLIEGDGRIFTLGRLPADVGPWTVLLAPDPRGPPARADPAGAAAAVPRVRVGAGQRLGLAARSLAPRSSDLLGELGVAEHATVFVSLASGAGAGGGAAGCWWRGRGT